MLPGSQCHLHLAKLPTSYDACRLDKEHGLERTLVSATVLASQEQQEQQPKAPESAAAAEEEPRGAQPASVPYTIVVCTSDQRGAGTDANVRCILYGPEGEQSTSGLFCICWLCSMCPRWGGMPCLNTPAVQCNSPAYAPDRPPIHGRASPGTPALAHGACAGDTGTLTLDNRGNNFERGAMDTFSLSAPDVGRVERIKVSQACGRAQQRSVLLFTLL